VLRDVYLLPSEAAITETAGSQALCRLLRSLITATAAAAAASSPSAMGGGGSIDSDRVWHRSLFRLLAQGTTTLGTGLPEGRQGTAARSR